MSYDAIRWAMEQAVEPALTKFLLVAMADCVNAEAGQMVCWPSYAFLARRTGMNTKTVEAGVFRLKQEGYLVDTGKRAGDTGKVVVYRLNAPESGGITPGPQSPSANGTRPLNTPESGVIDTPGFGGIGARVIPPNTAPNPPKSDVQSPQKVGETTPKTGVGTNKGTRKGTRKEPGDGAAVAAIPGVPSDLLADWMVVRKTKRAGPLTATAVQGLLREAGKAGITAEAAVRFCCEVSWTGFNAGWYRDRVGDAAPAEGGQARQETFV